MQGLKSKLFCGVLLATAGVQQASAQVNNNTFTGENSPYSRFGIGDLRNQANVVNRAMGGIGMAYNKTNGVNYLNPASYAFLGATTFEVGAEVSTRNIVSGSESYRSGTGSPAYVNIGVPLGKNFGLSFGLVPFSRTYYNFQSTDSVTNLSKVTNQFMGKGSINQAYIGGAGKWKGLSLGVNFGYMFGTSDVQQRLLFPDSLQYMNSNYVTSTTLGNIFWNGGLMYEYQVKKNHFLRAGFTYSASQMLKGKQDETVHTFRYNSLPGYTKDTAYASKGVKGDIVLPQKMGFGLMYENYRKLQAGIDFQMADWSSYTNYGAKDSVAASTWMLNAGVEYTPDFQAVNGYLRKVSYRLGFYTGTNYVYLHNTPMNVWAVTVGAGLPFRKNAAALNLALEAGQRANNIEGLPKESFVKFSLGLSLTDMWFRRPKYN
jgi:hypothetical protein